MATWIFKCDPKLYRLSDRLADPNNAISWLVTKYKNDIQPGDTVFLMETGPKRSILAIMRVDESPQELEELESEQAYWVSRDTERRCRIRGTIIKRVDLPIEELKGVEASNICRFSKVSNKEPTSRLPRQRLRFCLEWSEECAG